MTPISENACPYTPPSLDEPQGDSSEPHASTLGLMAEAANLFSSLHSAASKSLDLFAMETQRASLSLTWMFALASVLAVLVISAWLGLMAVLALIAVAYGWSWIAAILVVVAINLCAAFGVIYWCQQLSKDLLFAASRRQFAQRLVAQSSAL